MESGPSDISSMILSKIDSTKIAVVKRSSNFGGTRCRNFLEGALYESFGMKQSGDGQVFLCAIFRQLFLRAQGFQEPQRRPERLASAWRLRPSRGTLQTIVKGT